jgi:hypothetical protein
MVFAVVCYTIYSNSGFWRRKETNQVLFGRAMYDGAQSVAIGPGVKFIRKETRSIVGK